jgi:hypothetical protein
MKILFYFQAPQCLEKHNRTVRIVPPKDEGAFKLKNWLKLKLFLCKILSYIFLVFQQYK